MASSYVAAFLTDIPCLITHPETPYVPSSILITRLPGVELAKVCKDCLENGDLEAITEELRLLLDAICGWTPPAGPSSIRSITGEPTRCTRVLDHGMGPFDDQKEFTRFVLAPASPYSYNPRRSSSTTYRSYGPEAL
ncbi:hypothetical protein VM1G_08734 [Cytospora mali]|uniref:Uncharacterized protein n=1 Tax=Cytospora mali TaxID=578113 RepID=A0A194WAH3_CYTMA|nr:hypothetical protein VM1G_08734 [Valsa mali]